MKPKLTPTKYYVLSYDQEHAFRDFWSAVEYDESINPEYHGTSDDSLDRAEEVVIECVLSELNIHQMNSLNIEVDDEQY